MYGAPIAILLAWDILPDRNTHPSGESGAFSYFVTYTQLSAVNGLGWGHEELIREMPIESIHDLRSTEEYLRREQQLTRVVLTNCKATKSATPQVLDNFREAQKLRELGRDL